MEQDTQHNAEGFKPEDYISVLDPFGGRDRAIVTLF